MLTTAISEGVSVYLILIVAVLASAEKGVLWRKLKISHASLLNYNRQSRVSEMPVNIFLSFKMLCALSCHQVDWCNVWCPDLISNSCLQFQMYVSPEYQETNLGDALGCYTRNFKNYAIGSLIYGAPAHTAASRRVKEHLTDGIYEFGNIDDCYFSSNFQNSWFKLDLGSIKPIRRVMFVTQPNWYGTLLYDVDVRVGMEDLPGPDFSKYVLFGHFPGPSSESLEVELTRQTPIMARYVVVQRLMSDACRVDENRCFLQLCFLDIN